MGEEDLVVVMGKRNVKGKSVVGFSPSARHLPSKLILIIVDILSSSMPASPTLSLFYITETQNFHSIVVKRVRFGEVYDVYFDFFALRRV